MKTTKSKAQFPSYKLKVYQHILSELSAHFPDFPDLKKKVIIELGPGTKLGLLKYLRDYSNPRSIQGIGRSIPSFWQKKNAQKDMEMIQDSFILPALQKRPANSVDIIISRHVLEQHSIEAAILLKNPELKKAIINNHFDDLPESFPASVKNIQAIFGECYRILKPGGVIITQIAKKKYRVLIPEGLQAFKPRKLNFKDIGKFSEISTFVK